MPELFQDRKTYTLAEVANSIKRTLNDRYTSGFWVRAEMNKLNYYSHSGHCYPDLVEKQNGRVVAQFRSTLWNDKYKQVNQRFIQVVGEPLKDGIKILFFARVYFDAQYGLSLHIEDIDPSFTLGDLEQEKQETIDKLRKEGLFEQNKKLALPLLPQRLAIISVETSKGYADFMEVIENNQWHYHFFHMLFPAVLQGENAIDSILSQLSRIEKVKEHFDAVAIIRGGGGDVGLSCYNNYHLSKRIATYPLPVLTGIGHATNVTVAEMVSHQHAITPTKIGEFLIQKFHLFAVPLQEAQSSIVRESRAMLSAANNLLQQQAKLFKAHTQNSLNQQKNSLSKLSQSLNADTGFVFRTEQNKLSVYVDSIRRNARLIQKNESLYLVEYVQSLKKEALQLMARSEDSLTNLARQVSMMSPEQTLKRGYSITLKNGKAVRSADEIREGETITTVLHSGEITSTVNTTKLNHE